MARICGICPVSHLIASAKACDALLAVKIPPTADKLRRNDPHVEWARAVAGDEKVQLLDLNNLIADQYDMIGRDTTTALFESGPHTNRKGAEFTARVIADSIKSATENPLAKFLREKPAANW
jgi:lysophospholipase L1-like esterase